MFITRHSELCRQMHTGMNIMVNLCQFWNALFDRNLSMNLLKGIMKLER